MSEEEVRRGKKMKKQGADLIEIIGKIPTSSRSTPEDELSRVIDEQIRLKTKEYKLKLLDKMSKELDKELVELDEILKTAKPRETLRIDAGSNHIDIDIRLATELAKMPEEERKKVIETYAMLRAAERSAANPNILLPMLIGFSREHRDASKEEMFQWGKLQLETMKTAWDMAKAGEKPRDGSDSIKLFMEVFKEILEKDREARKLEFEMLMKKMEEMRQPSLLEAIVFDEKTRNALKEIGLFNPPRQQQGIDPRIQLQIEQMKMQHEKDLKRMEMEFQLKLEELRAQQQRTAAMLQGIRQIGFAAAQALTQEDVMSEQPQNVAMATGEKVRSNVVGVGSEPGSLSEEVVTLDCPTCKKPITFPKTAETVQCPFCNSMYRVKKTDEGEQQ